MGKHGLRARAAVPLLFLAACATGLAEAFWTWALILVLKASVYSFTVTLTAFPLGSALGGLLSAGFLAISLCRPLPAFGAIEIAAGRKVPVPVR